jgi:hypothetical protein
MATVEPSDLTAFEADYARGRRRRVLAELVPVAAYVALLAALTGLRPQVLVVSALALVLALVALWRGEAMGRAVYPGMLVGVVPFACSFAGGRIGHVCTGDACVSLCMPLCAVGGAIAGLLVARAVRRERSPLLAVVMGALALAIGSLGCPHAGVASLSAMGLGLVGPIALARIVALVRGT